MFKSHVYLNLAQTARFVFGPPLELFGLNGPELRSPLIRYENVHGILLFGERNLKKDN